MYEQVVSMENLRLAAKRVIANGGSSGIDGQTVEQFAARLEENLQRLQRQLRSGSYRPLPLKRVWASKDGTSEMRPLGVPTVRDRVVQTALMLVLGPVFEPDFANCSYGFRPGRGCHDALRQVITLLEQGYVHVVDADITKFFDNINHITLLSLIKDKVQEEWILRLIRAILKTGVLEGSVVTDPGLGTPQGGPSSPLLANIYLNPMDHHMEEKGCKLVRYADDFIILCLTRKQAEDGRKTAEEWLSTVGLSLHPDKTRTVEVNQSYGFDFLGYRFQSDLRSPRPKNIQKLKVNLWNRTRRSGNRDPEKVVGDVNQVLIGWWQHFQLTNKPQPFLELDAWIQGRIANLRSLRKGRNRNTNIKHITRKLFQLSKAFKTAQYDEGFVGSKTA